MKDIHDDDQSRTARCQFHLIKVKADHGHALFIFTKSLGYTPSDLEHCHLSRQWVTGCFSRDPGNFRAVLASLGVPQFQGQGVEVST